LRINKLPSLTINKYRTILLLGLILLIVILEGCFISKKDIKETAQDYYIFGTKVYEKGDYEEAQKAFQKILNEYPDSNLRKKALLSLADSEYKNAEYDLARFHYLKFVELYPSDPEAELALFKAGMCNFTRLRPDDRDQEYTREAIEDFEKLLLTYPNGAYAREALDKILFCKNKLAAHELAIGLYYFKKGAYISAIQRFDNILIYYPHISFRDKALFYKGESYYKEESFDKATETFKDFINQYPNSPLRKKAEEYLAKVERVAAEETGKD
jgi:outer membrane protein assembly factor BamD